MTQSLYPILLFALGQNVEIEMKTDWSRFSLSYSCFILLVIVLLMVQPRDTMYVQRVNAFGVVFVMIFLFFILVTGFKAQIATTFVYSQEAYDEAISTSPTSYTALVPLFAPRFTPLLGILGGGFYFHNMSLSILKNAERPEHNVRNVAIGFFMVFLTYSLVGVFGVYGFLGTQFSQFSPSVNRIKENCLNMFASDDVVATIIRGCILCQLLCVNTLLFGMLRSQILLFCAGVKPGAVLDEAEAKKLSRSENFLISFLMTLPPIALAIWYPHVGKLGALIAAFSSMLVMYVLPLATFTKAVFVEQSKSSSDDHFLKL